MPIFSVGFARHKTVKAVVYGLVLCAMVLGLSVAPFVADTALANRECYPGSWFEQVNRNGSNHWRAVALIARRPIDTRVEKWMAYGPRGAQFWSNSISETYGRAYIYFSWPPNLPPSSGKLVPQAFLACLR